MYGPLDQDYWHQYAEDDNWTMRISDDDEYADYDDDDDVYVPHRPNIKRFKREAKPESTERVSYQVSSLTDLSARVVALNVSFGVVERNSPPVPDELRLKILSFSFPEKEELVERWAGFNSSIVHVSEAEEICASADCVKNLIQIGFRLDAEVDEFPADRPGYSHLISNDNSASNFVSIYFDRGRITSAHCSCTSSATWCVHIVAAAFERIRRAKIGGELKVCLPISDSLKKLDKEQMQKFVQYLLCENESVPQLLESAQELLDTLHGQVSAGSEFECLNEVAGAPDITTGPEMDKEATWLIDEQFLKEKCETYFSRLTKEGMGFSHTKKRKYCMDELWSHYKLFVPSWDNVEDEVFWMGATSAKDSPAMRLLCAVKDFIVDSPSSGAKALLTLTDKIVSKYSEKSSISYGMEHQSYRYSYGNPVVPDSVAVSKSSSAPSASSPPVLSTPTPLATKTSISVASCMRPVRPGNSPTRGKPTLKPPPTKRRKTSTFASSVWSNDPQSKKSSRRLPVSAALGFTPRPLRCAGISSEVARLWRIVVLNPRPSSGTRQEILQKISGWKKKVKGWRGLGVALKLGQVVDENPEVVKLMKTACRTVPSVTVCTEKRLEFRGETKAGMFSRGNNHSRIFDFQWPHRISFNCEIDLDIDTACYLIEALHFLGKKDESLRLAVSLSLAILAFYEGFIVPEGSEREKTSASRNVFLGGKTCASNKGVFKVKNRKRFPSGCTRVDPDGQLQLTTIVFLFDLLSKSAGVDAIIFEVSRDRLSSQSLAFQFGVVGLFLPMYPTRTGQLEVERHEYLTWLCRRLIEWTPAEKDFEFLISIGHHILRPANTSPLAPCAPLARVVFHHLFGAASALSDDQLSETQELGLAVAMNVLGFVPVFNDKSESWSLFQHSCFRHWAKLAEQVLCSVVASKTMLGRALACVLGESGPLSVDSETASSSRSISTKCEVACTLAEALGSKSIPGGTPAENAEGDSASAQFAQSLRFPAIRLMVHGLSHMRGKKNIALRSGHVKWLLGFVGKLGIEAIHYLIECKRTLKSYLEPGEMFDLCFAILKPADRSLESFAKVLLLSVLDGSNFQHFHDVFERCRHTKSARRGILVMSWVCERLQALCRTRDIPCAAVNKCIVLLVKLCTGNHRQPIHFVSPKRLGAMHIPHLEIALDFALEALESVNPERPIRRKKNKARSREEFIDDVLSGCMPLVICLANESNKQYKIPRHEAVVPKSPPFTAFVGCLTPDVKDEDLQHLFRDLKVKSVKRSWVESAFVRFFDRESLLSALKKSGRMVRSAVVRVAVPASRALELNMERVPRYPPFVAALTKEASRDHITSNEVFELFQNCKVAKTNIPVDQSVAYVEFDDRDSLIDALNRTKMNGARIKVDVVEQGKFSIEDPLVEFGSRHLSDFVRTVIQVEERPGKLADVLKQLCTKLRFNVFYAATPYNSRKNCQEIRLQQVKDACLRCSPLRELLQRTIDAYRKLLLGPNVNKLLEESGLKGKPADNCRDRLLWSRIRLGETAFKAVLEKAKWVHSISYYFSFQELMDEMTAQHGELAMFLAKINEAAPLDI